MSIFIVGPDYDFHSAAIEWSLRRAGFDVVRWDGLSWQRERRAALQFGGCNRVSIGEHTITDRDTVWLRRPQKAEPHPGVAASDQKFATEEYRAFYNALLYQIEWSGAFCINKWSSAKRIENKSVQLQLARDCGFRIPETVMTNASLHAEDFFHACSGDVVHKPFLPHAWLDEVARMGYTAETTILNKSETYGEDVFAYAPGIYQQKIEKQYDVRITMMGAKIFAVAMVAEDKVLDWRLPMFSGKVGIRPVSLPSAVGSSLHEFTGRADLAFGCFDMCVDEHDDWWFLEVNEAGQFLWVDDLLPECGLFHAMLEFLSGREPGKKRISFPSYAQCKAEGEFKEWIMPLTAETKYATLEREDPQRLAPIEEAKF